MTLNMVILKGNLGGDPQLTQTQYGKPVAVMKLAVERTTKANNSTGESARPDWFRLVAFDQLGERCARYLHKGSEIVAEGRLVNRQYQDEQDIVRTTTEIWLRNVEFLARWGERSDEGHSTNGENQLNQVESISERRRKAGQVFETNRLTPVTPVGEVVAEEKAVTPETEAELIFWGSPAGQSSEGEGEEGSTSPSTLEGVET